MKNLVLTLVALFTVLTVNAQDFIIPTTKTDLEFCTTEMIANLEHGVLLITKKNKDLYMDALIIDGKDTITVKNVLTISRFETSDPIRTTYSYRIYTVDKESCSLSEYTVESHSLSYKYDIIELSDGNVRKEFKSNDGVRHYSAYRN